MMVRRDGGRSAGRGGGGGDRSWYAGRPPPASAPNTTTTTTTFATSLTFKPSVHSQAFTHKGSGSCGATMVKTNRTQWSVSLCQPYLL
jgi:hypothetical protein